MSFNKKVETHRRGNLKASDSEIVTWKRLRSEQIADCKIFQLRRDYSVSSTGTDEHQFVCLECPDWVNIIPLTVDKQVLLIEQYRHGIEEITLEIPGGMVDGDDESPQTAAVRELLEETGYAPREVVALGKSRPNPAIQDNWAHHFLALDIEYKQEPVFDSTEHAVIKFVPLEEISQLIQNEAITHSLVVACFHRLNTAEARA